MNFCVKITLGIYHLEEIKKHGISFKITLILFVDFRGCQEVKVDLLLSPYYANEKALLDNLSMYKSVVRPDQWTLIVRTYVRLVRIYRLCHKYMLREYTIGIYF